MKSNKQVQTLSRIAHDPVLQQFGALYLDSVSKRSLQQFTEEEIADFIEKRFAYFSDAIAQNGAFKFYQPDPENDEVWAFEQVMPDSAHIVVTLDEIFKQYGLKVLHKYRPVVSVTTKNNAIVGVSEPDPSKQLFSLVYVEFCEVFQPSVFEAMQEQISVHMEEIRFAQIARDAIFEKVDLVSNQIKKSSKTLSVTDLEWIDLLAWVKENFSFFGYAAFSHLKEEIEWHATDSLGILDPELIQKEPSYLLTPLTQHLETHKHDERPFVFDVVPVESRIKVFTDLMRISLKVPTDDGTLIEHVFIGLLKRSSLHARNLDTPLIHLKMTYIFEAKHMLPGSYSYNEVVKFCTNTPKFELFRTPSRRLLKMVEDFIAIDNPNDVYAFFYETPEQSELPLMIVMPSGPYTRANIELIIQYLQDAIPYEIVDYIKCWGEEKARLHVYFKVDPELSWTPYVPEIEEAIRNIIQTWEDKFRDYLMDVFPRKEAVSLWGKYAGAFPKYHRTRRSMEEVVLDVTYIEAMHKTGKPQFNLLPFEAKDSRIGGKASMLMFYVPQKTDLVNVMPILQNLGIHVYDEMTTRVGDTDKIIAYIHAYRIVDLSREKIDEGRVKARLIGLLDGIFQGRTDDDRLNALALYADLDWMAINLLQTYRNVYRQIGAPYTSKAISETLCKHPACARLLVLYFDAKFNPKMVQGQSKKAVQESLASLHQDYLEALQTVSDVTEDTILKRLFGLMNNTLRTNYYLDRDTDQLHHISIKLDSRAIKQMPSPIPYKEIYVHDVGFEAVHLRFGPVARGGLRWSDRKNDFRTEVLGLVKTQQTKNVVIVPEGSKGGFYVKQRFDTRDKTLENGVKQYKIFINGLLDITDNVDEKGQASHPKNVVCYDDLDPYLVVAADKGTASFSDYANSVSADRNFWLGDAFASGGSNGYSHKDVGITAKGGWECVKLHFKEKGKDIQAEPFTVTGIGDMSGDVFGNGLLLSKCTQLVAAFNHMHIFVDPTPNPEKSWEERNRLFNLPRSTWEDYNAKLISKGGGVFSRKAKSIPLSPEMKKLLGVNSNELTGEQLIRAILKMQVELIWFGGIGTYIKSPNQRHVDVGDPANDSVRIDSSEVKARVIGEGANLGLTQEARVDASIRGIALNTDFIDNSAGVNMSDYEVNLKILMKLLLDKKKLASMKARNTLLKGITDNVTDLVLANNQAQHRLISMDGIRSKQHYHVFMDLIQDMIATHQISAHSEAIPARVIFDQNAKAGKPVPRPVIAIVQSHVKMKVYKAIVEADYLDHPFLADFYAKYYPEKVLDRFGKQIGQHHLKKEILATVLTNHIVNNAGSSFFYEVQHVSGGSYARIAHLYLLMEACFDADNFRFAVANSPAPLEAQYQVLVAFQDMLKGLVIDLIQLPDLTLTFDRFDTLRETVVAIRRKLTTENANPKMVKKWGSVGFFAALSRFISVFPQFFNLPEIFYLEQYSNLSTKNILPLIWVVDKAFSLDWLKSKIYSIKPENHWEVSNKDVLIQEISLQRIRLISYLEKNLSDKELKALTPDSVLKAFRKKYPVQLDAYKETMDQLKETGKADLTNLTVTVHKFQIIK